MYTIVYSGRPRLERRRTTYELGIILTYARDLCKCCIIALLLSYLISGQTSVAFSHSAHALLEIELCKENIWGPMSAWRCGGIFHATWSLQRETTCLGQICWERFL